MKNITFALLISILFLSACFDNNEAKNKNDNKKTKINTSKNILFIKFNYDKKLSSLSINCIVQDKNYFYYIATDNGLYKSDGNNMIKKISDFNFKIYTLVFDNDSTSLWIGSQNNGLIKYDIDSSKVIEKYKIDIANKGTNYSAYSLLIKDSIFFVGTSQGLFSYNSVSNSLVPIYKNDIIDFYKIKALKTSNNFLYFTEDTVYKQAKIENNTIKITEDSIISQINYIQKCFPKIIDDTIKINELSNKKINHIIKDSLKILWIATDSGLYTYSNNVLNSYHSDEINLFAISSNNVLSTFTDKDSCIWVGTDKGLNYINRHTNEFEVFQKSNKKESLATNNIYDICFDSINQLVFLATEKGISYCDSNDNFYLIEDTKTLKAKHLFLQNDTLFFATEKEVFAIKNKEVTGAAEIKFLFKTEMPILSLFADIQNGLFVGTKNGLYFKKETIIEHTYDFYIKSILTLNNRIIIGTLNHKLLSNSIVNIDNGNWNIISDSNNISKIQKHKNSIYYISDYNKIIKSDTNFEKNTVIFQVPENIFDFDFDNIGKMWICTENAICKNDTLLNFFIPIKFLTPIKSFRKIRFINNKICLVGKNGLMRFNPTIISDTSFYQKSRISKIKIDGKEVAFQKVLKRNTLKIDASINYFSIEFSAFRPVANHYFYKIVRNKRQTWYPIIQKQDTTIKNSKIAIFSNLAGGTYELEYATNKEMKNSNKVLIKVKPGFWVGKWGGGVILCIIIFVVIALWQFIIFIRKHKLITKKLINLKQKLEKEEKEKKRLENELNSNKEAKTVLMKKMQKLYSIAADEGVTSAKLEKIIFELLEKEKLIQEITTKINDYDIILISNMLKQIRNVGFKKKNEIIEKIRKINLKLSKNYLYDYTIKITGVAFTFIMREIMILEKFFIYIYEDDIASIIGESKSKTKGRRRSLRDKIKNLIEQGKMDDFIKEHELNKNNIKQIINKFYELI